MPKQCHFPAGRNLLGLSWKFLERCHSGAKLTFIHTRLKGAFSTMTSIRVTGQPGGAGGRTVWQGARCGGTHREAGVAWLDPQLRQHPDAVGQFQGLVEHILALHGPLGDGEDVAVLQLAAHGLCGLDGLQSAGAGAGTCQGQHGSWDWASSPALRGQSLIWNWASFSLGMSFHVARNICLSAG